MPSFTISTAVTTTQTLSAGETGVVTSTGSVIEATVNAAVQISGAHSMSLSTPLLNNAGTIRANASPTSAGVYFGGASGGAYIVNTGIIEGAFGIYAAETGIGIVLDNAGTLGGSNGAVVFGGSSDMLILRNGSFITALVADDGGIDWVNYAGWTGTGIVITLGGAFTGSAANITGFENVYGSEQTDVITGDGLANVLVGLGGRDTIHGGGGNDVLWGLLDRDSLMGGGGDDTLYGGADNDRMEGGTGNDTYQVTDGLDVVTELAGEGFDVVFTTVSWLVTSAHVEGVYAVGSDITLTGGTSDDVLVADAAAGSILDGRDGADTLWGQAGADVLTGGNGNDVLRGGGSLDQLTGGAGDDQLVGGAGNDIFVWVLTAPFGTDEVFDWSRAQADQLRFFGAQQQAVITVVGGNTIVTLAQGTIHLYGVTDLTQQDLLFV